MDYKNLFEKFNEGRKLLLPDAMVAFDAILWSKHPTFEGVELKHIITSEKTDSTQISIGIKNGGIIRRNFFEELSEREVGLQLGATQSVVNKCKAKNL